MKTEKPDLPQRTKAFALRVIRLHASLPRSGAAQVIGMQGLRSATSVGAHVREAQRARSRAEFLSKLEVAQQELEETRYWLELLTEGEFVPAARLAALFDETDQLIAILAASTAATKRRP